MFCLGGYFSVSRIATEGDCNNFIYRYFNAFLFPYGELHRFCFVRPRSVFLHPVKDVLKKLSLKGEENSFGALADLVLYPGCAPCSGFIFSFGGHAISSQWLSLCLFCGT